MHSLIIESPAKLNLVLRVLGRRPDGYHRIYTLFHRISVRDTLKFQKRKEGIQLVCSHPRVPIKGNLIIRAFYLLKEKCPFRGGVSVRLTKRIPVGGGLGGGSSNAASFLIGVNRLYRLGLGPKALAGLGGKLGADIPFFLSGARHAVGTGLGDRIRPIPFRRRLWFLLISDGRGLSTRRVYQGLRLSKPPSLTRVSRDVRMTSTILGKGRPDLAAPYVVNDLAKSAERLRPSLRKRLKSLRDRQLGSWQMSGSGPTLFAIYCSRRQALRAFHELRHHRFSGKSLICHTW